MATINRNRLHTLLSSAIALAASAYGVSLLPGAYTPFANEAIWNHQVQYIERTTGKPFAQWQQERSIQCTKEAAEQKPTDGIFGLFPQEMRDNYYRGCMRPAFEFVPEHKILSSFLLSIAHWITLYLVTLAITAWGIGYLLAKAIPERAGSLWGWLTSGHKPPP